MIELLAAVGLTPWAQPLQFRPLHGWSDGASGTFNSSYGRVGDIASPRESTAWMAKGVRYRDRRTADPPVATLSRFPRGGILVSAVSVYFASPPTRSMREQAQRALDHLELPLPR